jgi:hypothetical protein
MGIWQDRQGARVRNLASVSYKPTENSPLIPWAIRFDFTDSPSFVIALGEIVDGGVVYHPHSLVVIFDEGVARAYRPIESSDASWGGK